MFTHEPSLSPHTNSNDGSHAHTVSQHETLHSDASVEAAATPAAEAAAAVPTEEEAAAPAPAAVEPVTIGLKGLPVAIEAAKSKGLTPLIIDSSEDHKVAI